MFETETEDIIDRARLSEVQTKMNKKAKLREIEKFSSLPYPNIHFNLYNCRRKLLIFDINKVLLYRQAKTSYFKIRPYAHEFIAGMSERFTLAVWTSMTKKCAKPILAELFPRGGVPLLFNWYQNMCITIPGETVEEKPLFLKDLKCVWEQHRLYNESNTILVDDSSEKCVRNPAHTCIQPHPYDPYGSSMQPRSTQPVSSSLNASVSEIENTNVVVVTDIVVPSNFCSGVKVTDQSAGVTEVEVTGPSSNSENIAPTFDISADSSVVSHSLEIPASSTIPGINTPCGNDNVAILPAVVAGDEELKPNGPLWVYLDRIAQYEGSTKDLFDLCGPYVC